MDRIDIKRVQVLNSLESSYTLHHRGELVVRQIMTPEPSCIEASTTVLDLVRMIHAKAFRHLLVIDELGRLLGVISDRDVLRAIGPGTADKEKLTTTYARDLMSTDLVTVRPDTPLVEAIGVMIDQGISCLPVVESGHLVGIMTNTDLHVVLQILLQTVRLSGSAEPAPAAAF